MPKSYSAQERAYIQKRLKEEAAKCLVQYGFRRTTVDEIVRRVKIPKGTFYLFYKSKELLLFDAILEQHDRMEQKLHAAFAALDPAALSVDTLTELLFSCYKMAAEFPILRLIGTDEIELLARKLPPETVAAHLGHDGDMVARVFAALPVQPGVRVEPFSAAFRVLYFASLHNDELGGENDDDALRLLLRGLAMQILPPNPAVC